MNKSLQVVLVSSLLLVAPAHAGGDKDKSPEDVFNAFYPVWKKGDAKAYMLHLTRESQSAFAGFMFLKAAFDKGWNQDKTGSKEIEEVLKRHGLSDDGAWKKAEDFAGKDAIRAFAALGETVKDKPAFLTDVLKIFPLKGLFVEIGEGKLKEVKIDGKQAEGKVTILSVGGKESTQKMYFKSENGVWKIDLIPMLEEAIEQEAVNAAFYRLAELRTLDIGEVKKTEAEGAKNFIYLGLSLDRERSVPRIGYCVYKGLFMPGDHYLQRKTNQSRRFGFPRILHARHESCSR